MHEKLGAHLREIHANVFMSTPSKRHVLVKNRKYKLRVSSRLCAWCVLRAREKFTDLPGIVFVSDPRQ